MISTIFLPEKIGSHFLFAKRIIAFEITTQQINATVVFLKGKNITIEHCLSVAIEDGQLSLAERTAQAIRTILNTVGKYDAIHTALSSDNVIFKELTLPFLNDEKIKLVLHYEVEQLLPFSTDNAVLDFVITKQNIAQKNSDVLVAAVQNQHIKNHLQIFEKAGVQPHVITVNMLSLYSLFQQIPSYADFKHDTVLLDCSTKTARLAYIQKGQLRFVRTMQESVTNSQEQIENFAQKILFSLRSFTAPKEPTAAIKKILISGHMPQSTGFVQQLSDALGIACEQFDATELLKQPTISLKKRGTIPESALVSLATALPSPLMHDFNLRQKEFALTNTASTTQQFMFASVLLLLLAGTLGTHSYMQIKKLTTEMHNSEKETLTELKKYFKKIDRAETDLEDAVEQAQQDVRQEEELWFAFSSPARASFLKYLLELTNKIDQQSLGFVIKKVSMSSGTMHLSAQVTDYEALKILEKELRQSPYFSHVEPQDNPMFEKMEIQLAKNGEEE